MEHSKKSILIGQSLNDKHPNVRQCGAQYAIYILFFMNLLNHADKLVPSAVKPLYQKDLGLTDFQSSLPISVTILVFMVFAPIYGYLSDYNVFDRRILLFTGVFLWSIATALAALSQNLTQLVCIRAVLGIGEAAYGTIGRLEQCIS